MFGPFLSCVSASFQRTTHSKHSCDGSVWKAHAVTSQRRLVTDAVATSQKRLVTDAVTSRKRLATDAIITSQKRVVVNAAALAYGIDRAEAAPAARDAALDHPAHVRREDRPLLPEVQPAALAIAKAEHTRGGKSIP